MKKFDVIVIGAGHAGIEAASACARMSCQTLLLTMDKKAIGRMSCNPAIGGIGKGQLVREIDALGGQMAKAADACGIQFRTLNASKGPAVRSSRAQIDMYLYEEYMQQLFAVEKNLLIKEGEAKKLIIEDGRAKGVILSSGEAISSQAVVVCPGTFLDGVIHLGMTHTTGGRINEPAACGLADALKNAGLRLLRFKTGTCPRLDKRTIDFSKLIVQEGDQPPRPLSFSTKEIRQIQVPCYITYTNESTHKIILDNLERSPLYSGKIKATGVRYCPSVEDKIVKFSDRTRHQVFLEPQGVAAREIYPNGLSTSLPEDVQLKVIHSIDGLERAEVIRFGYGIEHTVVEPTQLFPTLETKPVENLFLAGQINGTTGYEEAAAQGLVAGINAALAVHKLAPLVLERSSSYIGVLIDDLTTRGTAEPYRMFTSRVEYRLILREDNADLRLRGIGKQLGLVSRKDYLFSEKKKVAIAEALQYFKKTKLKPSSEINAKLAACGTSALKKPLSLEDILKRPQINLETLKTFCVFDKQIKEFALPQVEIAVKYDGFIQRQLKEVERFRHLEKIKLPPDIDYGKVRGLSREIVEKLSSFKPVSLGQASRIPGVTPAAISLLLVYLKKING